MQQACVQNFDLYYGDATTFSERGYVPYAWQFKDETIGVPSHGGKRTNLFGIYNRDNDFHYWISQGTINSACILNWLDEFSWRILRPTVLVLDNASSHRAKKVRNMIPYWRKRGLHLFFLPPYSPHLNIIERLWKEIKARYLRAEDYQTTDHLFYAVNRICSAVSTEIKIDFSK